MHISNTAQPEGQTSYPRAAPLEFRAATKRYPGEDADAVHALTLEVPAGDVCVLVGPSGCGKTTAMRMVNRLIDITDGDILLDGRSVRDRDPSELRREIGYVIQQIGLFPHQTIAQNIATVPKLLGWDRARIARRTDELLALIGLPPELRDRYPGQISGGQRQRVGVARALAADPPLMLMDEPFGAIDPITRERLQDEFLRLQADIGKTIVFVTHDIDEAIKMGDRIAVLREGGILAQYAPPDELLSAPADDFVARFVGTDRSLKRLSLATVGELQLLAPDGYERNGEPAVRRETSLREALALILSHGGRPLPVVEDDGELAGLVSTDLISGVLTHVSAERSE